MKGNLGMIITISILIAVVVWWYGEDLFLTKEKDKLISQQYGFGSLDPNLTGETIAPGCTDPSAMNYSKLAEQDDGSCIYKFGCCDVEATNYDPEADSCDIPDNNLLCDYGEGVGFIPNKFTREQWHGCFEGQEEIFGKCDWLCKIILLRQLSWSDLKDPHCWIKLYTEGLGNCPAVCKNGTPADNPNYQAPISPPDMPLIINTTDPDGFCGQGDLTQCA